MIQYLGELAGYGIILCFMAYTGIGFLSFLLRKEESTPFYILQSILIFMLQLFLFSVLMIKTEAFEYLFFYLFVQIFLLTCLIMTPLIYETVNRLLLSNMTMLLGIGLFVICRLSMQKAVRQLIIALIALAVSFSIPFLVAKLGILKNLTWLYAALSIGCLLGVYLLGEITHGSKITFTIAESITFQPSEFVKILFLFFLAALLKKDHSFARVSLSAVFAGCIVLLPVLSKDLGSALIFFVSYIFVVFAATGNILYVGAGFAGGAAAACFGYQTFAHVRTRVLAWQDPWKYIDSKGWAITQSLFAIGSGSWFGMGIMQGNPKSIPYVDQDFIFSSICEELGALFAICLLLVSLLSFLCMCRIALKATEMFYRLVAFGIGVLYIFQIFLTVGGGINLIPLTGVTLPFISYGGSSCMTSVFMFFIVQGIQIRNQSQGGEPADEEEVIEEAALES